MGIEDFTNKQVDVAKDVLSAAQELLSKASEAYATELQKLSQPGATKNLNSSAAIFQTMVRVDQAERAVQRAESLVRQREQEVRDVRR